MNILKRTIGYIASAIAGYDYMLLSFGGMCVLDWLAFVKYNWETGKWELNKYKFRVYVWLISLTGFNAAPISCYCVGRVLKKMKELCQPWHVNENDQVDFFSPLNDNYFEVLFDAVEIMNEFGIEPIYKIINQCEYNFENREEFTPFNPKRNIQGISKFYDPKAYPIVKTFLVKLLTIAAEKKIKWRLEFGNEIDNIDAVPLLEQVIMPTIKSFGYTGEETLSGARMLQGTWLNKRDEKGREMYDYGGRYDAQWGVRRLMTSIFGKPYDDLFLRVVHGLWKTLVKIRGGLGDMLYQAMDELSDFALLLSDDGKNRINGTPEAWTTLVNFVFQHKKMKYPFVSKVGKSGRKVSKINIEHLMSYCPAGLSDSNPGTPDEWIQVLKEKEIPILKAIVAGVKKNTGWKFINENKYPEPQPEQDPADPGQKPDPGTPPPATEKKKVPLNWRGEWNNKIAWIKAHPKISAAAAMAILILLFWIF